MGGTTGWWPSRSRSRSSTTLPTRASSYSTTAGTGRPTRSRPNGPPRSSPSSRAIDRTLLGFRRGASPPLASRGFKRYLHGWNGRHSSTGTAAGETNERRRPSAERHRLQGRGASRSLVGAARRDRRQQPVPLFRRHLARLLRAAAVRRSGAFLRQPAIRPILVGDPVPGHHDRRHVAPDLLLGRRVRWHYAETRYAPVPQEKLHRDGPAAARRAA